MPQLTWNETRVARRLLRRRVPMERIIGVMAGKFTCAEITDAVIAIRAKEKISKARFVHVIGPSAIELVRKGPVIPDAVSADRDRRRLLVPASTTAACCGDPLPGYSAAERAPTLVPDEVRRDPLDALVFRRGQYKNVARYG